MGYLTAPHLLVKPHDSGLHHNVNWLFSPYIESVSFVNTLPLFSVQMAGDKCNGQNDEKLLDQTQVFESVVLQYNCVH